MRLNKEPPEKSISNVVIAGYEEEQSARQDHLKLIGEPKQDRGTERLSRGDDARMVWSRAKLMLIRQSGKITWN